MKTRMKIYAFLGFCAVLFIGFQAMAAEIELPITVCIVTLADPCACPNSNICEEAISEITPEDIIKLLNEIEPAAGVAEWTMEEPETIEQIGE